MRRFVAAAICIGMLSMSASLFAQTQVSATAFPASTVPGGTVVIHTGLANASGATQPVTATITVKNPGQCVSAKVNGGALALTLRPHETRLATLSTTVPAAACAGTYSVTVLVKRSDGTVIASHTNTFTVRPAQGQN